MKNVKELHLNELEIINGGIEENTSRTAGRLWWGDPKNTVSMALGMIGTIMLYYSLLRLYGVYYKTPKESVSIPPSYDIKDKPNYSRKEITLPQARKLLYYYIWGIGKGKINLYHLEKVMTF